MKKLLPLITLALSLSAHAAPTAVIYGANQTAQLIPANGLSFANQSLYIRSGSADPSAVPTTAPRGSLYLSTSGDLYIKTDAGLSTNWNRMLGGVTATSPLLVGTNTVAITGFATTSEVKIANATSSSNLSIVGAGGGSGTLRTFGSRGTLASPTASNSGDSIGVFGAHGYGTTGFSSTSRARMTMATEEAWTDSAQGSRIVFHTTPIGSTTAAERMRITAAGAVGIGMTPTETLDVTGTFKTTGAATVGGTLSVTGGNISATKSSVNQAISLIAKNTSAASGTTDNSTESQLALQNDASLGLRIQQYASGATNAASPLSGGPTGVQAAIFTDTTYPLSIGTNNIAAIKIDTSQNVECKASLTGQNSVISGNSTNPALAKFKGYNNGGSGDFFSITAGATATKTITSATGWGYVLIQDQTGGNWARVAYQNGSNAITITNEFGTTFVTGAPGATESQLTYDNTTGVLSIKNGFATTRQYQLLVIGY